MNRMIESQLQDLDIKWENKLRRGIPITQISRLLSYEPAKRFGLHPRKGEIALMADADLVLVDMERNYILRQSDLWYKHPHSPYVGKKFDCRVVQTWCRGKLVYEVGQGISQPPTGVLLQRE